MRGPARRSGRANVLPAALALCAVLACGGTGEPPKPPPGAIAPGQSIGSAVLSGRALFPGAPPARRPIQMSGEAGCHKPGSGQALSEDLVVAPGGGVRNVWVRVVSGLGDRVFAPPEQAIEIDQAGCLFTPHVSRAQVNQKVLFKNSDALVHNVHAVAKANPGFNVSLSGQGRSVQRFFEKPEAVRLKCDLHAWMSGYVVVGADPFQAITAEDGTFKIEGLPAGAYELEAWHESLGTARQSVTLADGERKELTFELRAMAKP